MQWIASGFLFARGNTVIHRMDPRSRLLLSLALFVVALLTRSLSELIIVLSLVFMIVGAARILHRFARAMVFSVVISFVAFVLNYAVAPAAPYSAVLFGLRLFAVISSTSLFFLTSTPDELEQVMRWLRLPSDFVMVFVIAVRFVPVLLMDALQIMDAQRSRGLEFDRGGFVQRMKNSIPVVVPLIAVALDRSLDLAEAMDSRAYGATKKPTSLYQPMLRKGDYAALILISIGAFAGLYASFFFPLP
jgi:energy-coupling factor transport system permease protein